MTSPTWKLLVGDVREQLATLPDASVQCCVTSPPYWGLRDYGVEGQLGIESTPDAYVAVMVEVFQSVWRVLKDDGVCWLNLGDSYAGSWGAQGRDGEMAARAVISARQVAAAAKKQTRTGSVAHLGGLKAKDLVGIPWSVAKALQAPQYMGNIHRERDRVWLAAMIDGEGTICGFIHERKDDGRIRTGSHIYITNASTALLDEAHRIWPASRSEHSMAGAGHLGKRDVFRWIPHSADRKADLLAELYPYLIAKRVQALLAWNLLQFVQDGKRLGRGVEGPANREKRAHLVRLLGDANAGRAVDVPSWCVEPPSMHQPGWYLRSDVIWSKPNPMPESVQDRPTKAHEYVFLLTKSERYYYDADAIREPETASSLERYRYSAISQTGKTAAEAYKLGAGNEGNMTRVGVSRTTAGLKSHEHEPHPNGRNARSVWTITTQPYPEAHFATFPEALPERCIKAGSRIGDTVLDPFTGSGTTGAVALRLGRSFVGCELNPAYADLARMRIGGAAPLFASEATA